MKEDAELKKFRDLMPAPDKWVDGFGMKAMIGGLFVGLIMTPASLYMNLVIGQDIGAAAQWVTIILFIELARRSFTILGRAEIYVLYYMAGACLVSNSGLLWNQFLVQSDSMRAFGLADKIPWFVAPSSPDVLGQRSFFHSAWLAPIGLMALGQVLGRLDNFGLAYIMYRLTSDVEKLPFPLAPVGAQGITALADASGGQETWRWRVFSFGSMLGMAFSVVYLALPAVSGALLGQRIEIFALPFYDATKNIEDFLPAVPFMISFNLGFVIAGMVLPFWAMVGSFIGLTVILLANPFLLRPLGLLKNWQPNIGAIRTSQVNQIDFYFSFGLGLLAAIAVIGFWQVGRALLAARKGTSTTLDWKALTNPPAGRGDFSLWIAAAVYLITMGVTIVLACGLLHWAHKDNPAANSALTWPLIGVFVFYGFIYTPVVSYVSARMEGIVGQYVQIPFVREATFILSGYQGTAIWFVPFPAHNYGAQVLYFRTTELTGTSFRSMIKAEAFVLPIAIMSLLVFSQMIWSIAPVPSDAFPFTQVMWDNQAFQQALIITSTTPEGAHEGFRQAWKPEIFTAGLGIALFLYSALSWLGMPVLLVYGVIRGLDSGNTQVVIPQFIGALLGRFYFSKKFGDRWQQYIIVFYAGFGAGTGLIMMLSLGIVFMSKAVVQSAY
jgi:hypothetical protein